MVGGSVDGPTFDIMSLLYGLWALYTLVQLVRNWGALFDARLTEQDTNLAIQAGFLLLTPIGVLLHEIGHYVVAQSYGAQQLAISFRLYWGFVSYVGQFTSAERFLIAAAGPAVSVIIGMLALAAAIRLGGAWSLALWSFAVTTLLLVLVLYPIMSFTWFSGDFRIIYSSRTPELSLAAGVVHLIAAAVSTVLYRRYRRPALAAPPARQSAAAGPQESP